MYFSKENNKQKDNRAIYSTLLNKQRLNKETILFEIINKLKQLCLLKEKRQIIR